MGLFDALGKKVGDFLWGIALKKGSKAAAKAIMAWVASLPLDQYGVSVSFEEAVFIAAATLALEAARNWLKHKVGVKGL